MTDLPPRGAHCLAHKSRKQENQLVTSTSKQQAWGPCSTLSTGLWKPGTLVVVLGAGLVILLGEWCGRAVMDGQQKEVSIKPTPLWWLET